MKKFIKILFIAISVILLLGIEFVALVIAGNKIGLSTDTVFYLSIIITIFTLIMLMVWQYVKTIKMIKKMADAGLIDINNYANFDNNDCCKFSSNMSNGQFENHIDAKGRYNPIPNSPIFNPLHNV